MVIIKIIERFFANLILIASILIFSISSLAGLAETLKEKLGARPSKIELVRALNRNLPKDLDLNPEDLLLPPEYTQVIFGGHLSRFIETAQKTNPFLNEEAGNLGYMTSNQIEDLIEWPYSPLHGQAFLMPRFEIPTDDVQIGHVIAKQDISPDLLKQMIRKDSRGKTFYSFWVHPDDLDSYEEFFNGGAKGVPKRGYGIHWDTVGIAFNGPRSMMVQSLSNVNLPPFVVKVNLHRKLEGSTRIIEPHKAARSVLATRLLLENTTPYQRAKWGFDFMPEVGAASLPYRKSSNVVRDTSILSGSRYVYAYSIFSPVIGGGKSDTIAYQLMNGRPTPAKFEKLAREVFALMAKPFAYNALVTGLNFEWHSANWLVSIRNGKLGDKVILQDMEALRFDPQVSIWNGGTARSLQATGLAKVGSVDRVADVSSPWFLTKYANAIGGSWESREIRGRDVELVAPEFLADEYLWRVRGFKDSKDSAPSNRDTMWGFSTIVDVARNYGQRVLGYKLKNSQVERWMDEEMAKAFNQVLREELKIPASVIPDVTVKQMKREAELTVEYEAFSYEVRASRGIENVADKIHAEGGITRALWQLKEYLSSQFTEEDAIPEIQNILAKEGDRLTDLRRNTRKDWYSLVDQQKSGKIYLLLHADARVIEVRDADGWLGFISLQPDSNPKTQKLLSEARPYLKTKSRGVLNLSSCKGTLGRLNFNQPFGDRAN